MARNRKKGLTAAVTRLAAKPRHPAKGRPTQP